MHLGPGGLRSKPILLNWEGNLYLITASKSVFKVNVISEHLLLKGRSQCLMSKQSSEVPKVFCSSLNSY